MLDEGIDFGEFNSKLHMTCDSVHVLIHDTMMLSKNKRIDLFQISFINFTGSSDQGF